ncbi:MAG: transcription antitermination factor NusB [Candidatus Taylorbacteria bacterium RIFCSPLOWO2_02_FULL_43_11]|uniref:Transcription antitermination protein NusB n=1 Tax=Candidatus Taylorbacteria bacterium RIFCSPHIGHO2_02_FULL_43_32b TaxID=1802306 RepID=A0A1G2MFH9_9BACT|nr:MAG: transcription antitermination factor NusB [Candidatus Taylorbacteria bacterium RIFCSPHIGHO2_01_FULL_43_47]OHA22627.1 MAG: transcription antitermination factor NusB [Candidatus Taylorbacteria bacterium RIFCSPHIGHO2_02_FULL_43_32b]OHA29587.1 MAG: transcription antitermination factor NusB [Candidatus Taylorbacteria bacterium RIFCSPLOWO2_01_FULL_43_44]OHA36316.1 MAG: transcription antitermination factor NusB [Candidatus Taylorbacteria bacterium RIFCSPLOWO2_02_FULL_43_11]
MANRHLARSVALQTLFEWDFNGYDRKAAISALERNVSEFAPGVGDSSFATKLVEGVLEKQTDIDLIIGKAAPEWPLLKIATIDRNILRIGLFELLFTDRTEVPPKVAINESIELAKTFGGESSSKFVNGVLGTVYKELGEPDKDAPKRALKKEAIPYDKLPVIKLGGAVVFARDRQDIYMALVHDIFGHWTLSKGKIEESEDEEKATIREIKEELGLDISIRERLGVNEYPATDPEKGKIRKRVTYFLAESPFSNIKLGTSGGLDDGRWFKLQDILDLNFYSDILPIVTKAINILLGNKK